MADLIGVWKSKDKRESRHVYVTRWTERYAYGFSCDARGRKSVGHGRPAPEIRLQLADDGTALKRYRRLTQAERWAAAA